jgi:hypothetical protein
MERTLFWIRVAGAIGLLYGVNMFMDSLGVKLFW